MTPATPKLFIQISFAIILKLSAFPSKINTPRTPTLARRYPLSYVYSGLYEWVSGRYLYGQGDFGYWWSALANNSSNAYYLNMHNSLLDPQVSNSKTYGWALRSNTPRRYPLSYVYSGNYGWTSSTGDGVLNMQGGIARFWTTLTVNTDRATSLRIYDGAGEYLTPQWSDGKTIGGSLRYISVSIPCPSVSAFVCIFWVLQLEHFWQPGLPKLSWILVVCYSLQ
ncbi:hypothetical protein IK112_01770 [Candidatus Saccharibacteria bacterium]|nr:hypothetical protein [Candidatus Saccharibacteria bacterium]